MRVEYADLLASKARRAYPVGLSGANLSPVLFDFQVAITGWALRMGRSAIFADCGLGKTLMQLEWARHIPGRVLIVCPLSVAPQTVREAQKLDMGIVFEREPVSDSRVVITNYHNLHKFDASQFSGVVLDESSILKSLDGKTKALITEMFGRTPYRLACTATPSPNDYVELGNHAEFLGICTTAEMLSEFFVHDGETTSEWRLKGHAVDLFWKWVSSWAAMIGSPEDLGFDGSRFILPELRVVHHTTDAVGSDDMPTLFPMPAASLGERREARRNSIELRARMAADIAKDIAGPVVFWCDFNAEADLIETLTGAIQVSGSDSPEDKESRLDAFSTGAARMLVTKPKIAGFGMNWQHCADMVFVGLSDSYESFYQAVRRSWRFGQTKPVTCHVITSAAECAVVTNIQAKHERMATMGVEMKKHAKDAILGMAATVGTGFTHRATTDSGDGWTLINGDCVEEVAAMPDASVDYSVFSPPFASLYTYSDSPRDMGNCRDYDEFEKHFALLVPELFRVMKPGRLLSFHCMNLPTSKTMHGYIGIYDFRGVLIKAFQDAGWIYHSEVCIWKDPVVAMQRTKALGLLYKQFRKDTAMCRQGIADYLVTMRKPGLNPEPVTKTHASHAVDLWQRYASPVWMDIDQGDTLQHRSARENADEKHICPLQLGVIRRAVDLWTNPGDVVLSPFAGIGSEGYVALEMERRFIGVELKGSYYRQAVRNLLAVTAQTKIDMPESESEAI